MIYVILIIMSAMIIISRFVINDKLSKVIILIYLFWWAICLGVSSFNLYELFPVQRSTYILLILNVGMFYLGFLFCGNFGVKNIIDKKFICMKFQKNRYFSSY